MVVALPLFAVTLTTNPVLISGLAVASGLPWLVVALPAGALVDRLNKRHLVVGIEFGRAALLGAMAVGVGTDHLDLPGVYVAAFLIGVGETFVAAVTRSVIPLLVEGDGIPSANGFVFAAETGGERFAGPAVGGLIFSVAAILPFVGDAVSFAASALLLRPAIPPSHAEAEPEARASVVQDVRTGLRWFFEHRELRILAVVVTSFAFCQAMAFAVLVLFATRTLHLGSSDYGLLLAIAAIGNVVASILAGRIHSLLGPFMTIIVAGLAAGVSYLAIGATKNVDLVTIALLLEAGAVTLGNVATLSARHRIIPPERFGLINNAFRMCVMGVVPVGSLVGGTLAAITGLGPTFLAAGAIQLVVLLGIALPLRSVTLTAPPPTEETSLETPTADD